MPKTPTKSTTPSLSERIVTELERRILGGQLRAGDRLPTEKELEHRYNTSRPIVREAVRELKARGLAISLRGSGCYVAERAWENPLRLSLEHYGALRGETLAYEELLDLRLVVETFCIRKITQADAGDARRRLSIQMARMERLKDDLSAFGKADLAFHTEIVHGAGNSLFITIYQGLIPSLGERFARSTYRGVELTSHTLRDHRAILSAVMDCDEAAAVKCLGDHLGWARQNMKELFTPTPPPA